MISLGRCLIVAGVLLTSGCASLMKSEPEQQQAEQAWQVHRDRTSQIRQFTLKGRVASGGMMGMKADMLWQQESSGRFSLRLAGPLGIGTILIEGDDKLVNVRTRKGEYQTDDPEGWIKEKMGWSLPIHGLQRWMLGLPAPNSASRVELQLNGLVAQLQQDGWTLNYPEYAEAGGYRLPKKLEATNGDVKVKILADNWSGLP